MRAVNAATTAPAKDAASRRRRRTVMGFLVVLIVAGIGIAVVRDRRSPAATATATVPTGLVTVAEGTLVARTSVSGTLTYAGAYRAVNQAAGIVTALPPVGKVITQGTVLYRVDQKPVVFLQGSTPMYRSLTSGLAGPDVEQLNAALVAAGYDADGNLRARSATFTWATRSAVKDLQEDLKLSRTGSLGLADVTFIGASRIRVTSVSYQLGAQAAPSGVVLTASSTARQVSVDVDAAMQTKLKRGEKVVITLPDGRTTDGAVTSVGTVVKKVSGGRSTVTVKIAPKNSSATGALDQAPVGVSIVTASVRNALTVPVNALLALLGGGYGIEVADPSGTRRIVQVELGLFDDSAGVVQVTGKDVKAGLDVVVPTS